jgi:hypothetical protein
MIPLVLHIKRRKHPRIKDDEEFSEQPKKSYSRKNAEKLKNEDENKEFEEDIDSLIQ